MAERIDQELPEYDRAPRGSADRTAASGGAISPRRPRPGAHIPALDGVRGLAILMVLALHFVGDSIATNGFERIVTRVCCFGVLGVDLFFALSGFLITGILIDAKSGPGYFRNFYARRALRIFPLYYAVLACVFFVAPLFPFFRGPELAFLTREQLWAWLYGTNILMAMRGALCLSYINHFWSLAIEEHFYLVWPLVVWLCPRQTLVRLSLGVALVSLAARAAFAPHVNEVATYVLTPFRLDSLCLGGLLAAATRGPNGLGSLRRAVRPMVAGAVVVLALTYAFNRAANILWVPLHEVRNAAFVVLLAALMVRALTAPPEALSARIFTSSAMRFLGRYSYGLYVFHHFIAYYFIENRTEFSLGNRVGSHTLAVAIQATLGSAVSIGVAMASYHAFEKHFIALKRFWQPKGGTIVATAPRLESRAE